MNTRPSSKWLASAVVGFSMSGLLGYSVVNGAAADEGPPSREQAPSGVTEDGRIWGPWSDDPEAPIPDLVRVRGDNGIVGYADADLVVNDPVYDDDTPEANLRRQEEHMDEPPLSIPVYDEDGTTQIDTFTFNIAGGFDSEDQMPEQ